MPDSKKRLLIIDDELDICELLKVKFEREGIEVLVAHEGFTGFQLAKSKKPNCILLDARIPGGQDGLTFLRQLRSLRDEDPAEQKLLRSIPVIILTAAGDHMRPLFEAEGITDYIEKPFDSKILKQRIEKILRS